MTKEEINQFIEDNFKKIVLYFHKAIEDFDPADIRQFRTEIKRLKVFLHLLSMESEDGLSNRITKRMKTIYGYFGVIQNFHLQLRKINEYVKKSANDVPVYYVSMLQKELEYWKKLSKDFIDRSYDFFNDKKEIITALPEKLTKKSIRKFIHYTLYELQVIAGYSDDYSLDNTRKFMEDLYYNYAFIKPFISERQTNLFDEKQIDECLKLFGDFRDKCMAIALLQTFGTDKLNEHEKQLLKEMEDDWVHEKKELVNQLSAKLDSMHIKANNLNEFALTDSSNE
jgi:CHAD domain-containing protein